MPELKYMTFIERLKLRKFRTLHYRRIWGHTIETYKLLTENWACDNVEALAGHIHL